MQKSFNHLTPQKKGLSIHSFHEDSLLKELSPQVMTVSSSNYGKIKLELMSSPLPTSKDLFAQLLASEQKIVDEEDFQRY